MARPKKRPTDKDRAARGRAVMAGLPKMSVTLLEFAKPLLALFPDPLPIEELRPLMTIVNVAWNLPLYEQRNSPRAAAFRATWDTATAALPPEVAKILSGMLYSRLTRYAKDPRSGFAEVVDGDGGQANVVATSALIED
jgi:hypothetical protein